MSITDAARELLEKGFVITFHNGIKVCGKAKYHALTEVRVAYTDGLWSGSGLTKDMTLCRKDSASSLDELLTYFLSQS